MNANKEKKPKKYSSHSIIAFFAVCMLIMAGFMFYCVAAAKKAPKDVWDHYFMEASAVMFDMRKGAVHRPIAVARVNKVLEDVFPQDHFSVHEANGYYVSGFKVKDIAGKKIVAVNMANPEKPLVTLGFFPMQKRQFPKHGDTFTEKGFLFLMQEAKFGSSFVGTNFYNDFFVLGVGEATREYVADTLIALTNLKSMNDDLKNSGFGSH